MFIRFWMLGCAFTVQGLGVHAPGIQIQTNFHRSPLQKLIVTLADKKEPSETRTDP